MKPKFGFLMSVAGDLATGGGALAGGQAVEGQNVGNAGGSADGTDASSVNDAAAGANVPKELSFVEKVKASFQSKGEMAAELNLVKERATKAEAELVSVKQQLQSVTVERDGLAKEKQEIADLLKGAQEQAKTVTVAAVEQVAQLGFTAAEAQALPGAQEQTESPIKQMEKEYAATSCPKEKGKIAAKMVEAMKAEA